MSLRSQFNKRLGIGGVDTVRGYARNQLLTDSGVLTSIESRFPLTDNPSTMQLAPFLDIGTGWNNFEVDPSPSTLIGLGLGLRWQPHSDLSLRLDYGIPLVGIDNRGNALQEQGFYFSLHQPLYFNLLDLSRPDRSPLLARLQDSP